MFRHGSHPPARPRCFPLSCGRIEDGSRGGTPADTAGTPRTLPSGLCRDQSLPDPPAPRSPFPNRPHPLGRGCKYGRIRNSWAAFPEPEARVGVLLREWKPRSHFSSSPYHPSSFPTPPPPPIPCTPPRGVVKPRLLKVTLLFSPRTHQAGW